MPQAPNSEIPYNVPWGARRGSPSTARVSDTHRVGTAARPQSQDAVLQRALEFWENPTQPAGDWLSKLVARAVGVITVVLILLFIIFALYHQSIKMSFEREELTSSRGQTVSQVTHTPSSRPNSQNGTAYREEKPDSYVYTSTSVGQLAGSSNLTANYTRQKTTEGSSKANQPIIKAVHFPEEIRADGTKISGRVYFQDPDADVYYVKFETLAGQFTPFEFAPDVAGRTNGSFGFRIYCLRPQQVMLKVTLFDRGGHSSPPSYFSFQCVIPYTEHIPQPGNDKSTALAAGIWPDKSSYRIDERVQIYFHIQQSGYVYVFDIDASGKVLLLFPNRFATRNFLGPGTYTLPNNTKYELRVAPPTGYEQLYMIVTPRPLEFIPHEFNQGFLDIGYQGEQWIEIVERLLKKQFSSQRWSSYKNGFWVYGS